MGRFVLPSVAGTREVESGRLHPQETTCYRETLCGTIGVWALHLCGGTLHASTPDLWALSVPLGGIHIFHLCCNLESIGCTLCVPSKREGVPHSDIVARKSPLVPINRSGALQCYLQFSLNQGAPPCGNALIEEPLHGIRTRRQIALSPRKLDLAAGLGRCKFNPRSPSESES